MEFLDLVKPYLEIGILGLCGIFTIGFAWLSVKKFIDNQDKNRDNLKERDEKLEEKYNTILTSILEQNQTNMMLLQDQLKNLTDSVINGVTRHTLSSQENNTLSEKEVKINECLRKTLIKTDATRVALVRFHNGGRDMNGLSFLKMSMTNETTKLGLASMMPDFQNIFRSFFSYWCDSLINDDKCYINNINELKTKDTTMYEFFKSRGIQAVYGAPLKNKEDTVIGFIYVEFMDKSSVDLEQVTHCLHDKRIKIETILN